MGCGASNQAQTAPATAAKPQPAMPKTIKLSYFGLRARAEPARLVLAAGDVKYEFNEVKQEDWPSLKPMAITGSLPILEVDGKPLGQSMAIGRLAARLGGLTGADDFEAAYCDMITDTCNEAFFGKLGPILFGTPEEEKAAAIQKYMDEYLPTTMSILQKIADKNKNGYFVGNKITWADIYFFSVFDLMSTWLPAEAFETVKDTYITKVDSFQKIIDNVKGNAGVAAYLQSRPSQVVSV